MNFRAFNMATGECFRWNSCDVVPGGGVGKTMPAAGTGVNAENGREIFCGDIVERGGSLYLVKLRRGGFWLEFLEGETEGGGGRWLHDFLEEEELRGGGMTVVGDTRSNSAWLVEIFQRRARRGGSEEVDRALGAERAMTMRAGGGTPELPQ